MYIHTFIQSNIIQSDLIYHMQTTALICHICKLSMSIDAQEPTRKSYWILFGSSCKYTSCHSIGMCLWTAPLIRWGLVFPKQPCVSCLGQLSPKGRLGLKILWCCYLSPNCHMQSQTFIHAWLLTVETSTWRSTTIPESELIWIEYCVQVAMAYCNPNTAGILPLHTSTQPYLLATSSLATRNFTRPGIVHQSHRKGELKTKMLIHWRWHNSFHSA